MIVLTKLLIVAAAVGLLRSTPCFQKASRQLDHDVLISLKRVMRAAEESGRPPELVPLLMMVAALTWMWAMAAKGLFVQ